MNSFKLNITAMDRVNCYLSKHKDEFVDSINSILFNQNSGCGNNCSGECSGSCWGDCDGNCSGELS